MEENKVNNAAGAAETNVNTESIKCKGCGSNMSFDPATQKLKCTYCGYTEDFEKSDKIEEICLADALRENATWNKETLVFRCENCGARVVAGRTETAVLCPFCGTSHVVAEEELEGIKPNVVVPFKFTLGRVAELVKGWAKRKFFAPNDFKKGVNPEKIKGVYMPFFTFDSLTDSVYEGRVGDRHTRTVHTKNGTRTETYVTWRHISGTLRHFFDDVLVNAGYRFEDNNVKKICPFDWTSACRYESKFLSGYVAHHYEKDINKGWIDAKKDIDNRIRQMIIASSHCDEVDYLNVKTNHDNVTYKYVMLPVYVINYTYKNKNYQLYANGSTGKIIGKSPISPWKAGLAGLLGAAGVIAIIAFIAWFMMN